jgi:hypothetical protein
MLCGSFVGVSSPSDVGQRENINKTKTKRTKYACTADSLTYFSACNDLRTKPKGLGFMQTGHGINPWQSTECKGAERRSHS